MEIFENDFLSFDGSPRDVGAMITELGLRCDVFGLRIEVVQQTMARAERLLAQTFHQAVGPGELELPAIRGVGGSLIYFIEPKGDLGRIWEIEFEAVAEGEQPEVTSGLQSIDHISQSMHYEEMLSWLLFYTSILHLDKTPQVDVADPGGLVQSQVVQSLDGDVRIALNGPHQGRSLASRFLSSFFSAGVQHIAFGTSDIFTTVQHARSIGLKLLTIPDNYYDDLEARFALDSDLLDRLREHNVLYDRDEHGEYLQAYTANFTNWLFFEIVERREYRGFGAINAPIRLAAQTRLTPIDAHVRNFLAIQLESGQRHADRNHDLEWSQSEPAGGARAAYLRFHNPGAD